jgi:hypothetical protein
MNLDLIYTNPFSISKHLCDEIIHLYESNKKTAGKIGMGVNRDIKDTLDIIMPNNGIWGDIFTFLENEIKKNIEKYIDRLNNNNEINNENSPLKYKIFSDTTFKIPTFMIQRYIKQIGKYVYHTDERIEWEKKITRVITFIWYLNTVDEGGETELWGNYKVKPEAGKILLFPACWTFPHTGKMPISDNKYIITGWIYI